MFLTNANASTANPVRLDTPVVKFIDKLLEIGDFTSSADAALIVLSGRLDEGLWQKVIDALSADRADIEGRIEKLRGYLATVEDFLDPVLRTLADEQAPHELDLARQESTDLPIGNVALSLGANASAAFKVHHILPGAVPADFGTMPEGDALQVFTATGSLGLTGSAAPSIGSISFGASASATAELYFQYPSQTPNVVALMASAKGFAPPWDLQAIATQLQPQRSDGSWVGLRGAQIKANGAFNLAGSASIGKSFTYQKLSKIPDPSIQANLGATLGFSLRRQGTFKIVLQKDLAGRVNVAIRRFSEKSRSGSIDLGADIDVTGLDKAARKYADQFLFNPDGIIEEIEAWKAPGDRIAGKIGQLDDEVSQQLGAILTGNQDTKRAAEYANQRVKKAIVREFNERINFWDDVDSAALARSATGSISGWLGLDERLAALLSKHLEPKLVEWMDEFKTELQEKITQVVTEKAGNLGEDAKEAVNKYLEPLEFIGEEIGDAIESVDELIEKARTKVLQWLRRYESIRKKIYDALETVAKLRVSLAFSAATSATLGKETLLSFDIVEITESTKRAYRGLLLGRADQAWDAFESARENGEIKNIDGVFKGWVNKESSLGLSLRIGDFAMSMKRVKAEDVNIEVAADGQIIVAGMSIRQDATSDFAYASRKASLVGAYELVEAAANPTAFPAPLGFTLAYSDEHMRKRELRQLLRSLEDTAAGHILLRQGATENAIERYEEIAAGDRSLDARMDLTLPVTISDFSVLLTKKDEAIRRRAVKLLFLQLLSDREKRIAKAMAQAYEGGVSIQKFIREVVEEGDVRRSLRQLRGLSGSTSRRSEYGQVMSRLLSIGRNARTLVEATVQIRRIAEMQTQVSKEVLNHQGEDPFEIRNELLAELEDIAETINDKLAVWLKPRGPISGIFTEEIPARTVVLLTLLSSLGGSEKRIMPVVRIADNGGAEFAVV